MHNMIYVLNHEMLWHHESSAGILKLIAKLIQLCDSCEI